MPAAANTELPKIGPRAETTAEWGAMRLDFAAFPPHNLAPLLKGLPGDLCPCPHWGYLFKGKILVRYGDHEETITAGQAFYLAPGHAPEALEDCELMQFSPADQIVEVIATITRNAQMMNPNGAAPTSPREVAEIARDGAS